MRKETTHDRRKNEQSKERKIAKKEGAKINDKYDAEKDKDAKRRAYLFCQCNFCRVREKENIILSLFSVHVKCSQKKDNCGSTISQNIMYQIRVKR